MVYSRSCTRKSDHSSSTSDAYIYMGGGAVDVKLGIPLNTFIKATNAGVADVSQAR